MLPMAEIKQTRKIKTTFPLLSFTVNDITDLLFLFVATTLLFLSSQIADPSYLSQRRSL
jgi:hypothetical protein